MNGTRLFHSKKIKYLDETLMGNEQCEEVAKKLSRANGILAKSRHYVPLTHLKNIYYATFSSNLFYGSQVWGQTSQSITDKILLLQKKSSKDYVILQFQSPLRTLFKDLKLLKVDDNIFLQNCLFVHDFFHGNLP